MAHSELPANLQLHPLLLRFNDRATENKFHKFYDAENTLFIRAGTILSILSWVSFIVLAYYVFPRSFHKFLIAISVSILPILILVLIATFQVRWMAWYQRVTAVGSTVAGFLTIYLTCFLIHNFAAGASGIIIVIFFSSLIARIKLTLIIASMLTYIVLFELLLFGSNTVPIEEQAVFSFCVLLSGFGAMFGAYVNESQLRTKFIQQKIIDAQHLEQLAHTEKLATLGTVIAGVAHEINNPNNSLFLDAQLNEKAWKAIVPVLDEHARNNGDFNIGSYPYSEFKEEFSGVTDRMKRNSARIKRIAEDLRTFAKKDIDFNEDLDVNDIVRSALSVIEHVTERSTRNLALDLCTDMPHVKGNSRYLEQVIVNLIKNACQALLSSDKGIFISTYSDIKAKEITVSVRDEGCGMDEKTLKTVFTPFYTTKGAEGTGLGLSICNNIVKNHGGKIDVESKVGQGTTIRVMLPIACLIL
jgi:signal transduction histidine kinase